MFSQSERASRAIREDREGKDGRATTTVKSKERRGTRRMEEGILSFEKNHLIEWRLLSSSSPLQRRREKVSNYV